MHTTYTKLTWSQTAGSGPQSKLPLAGPRPGPRQFGVYQYACGMYMCMNVHVYMFRNTESAGA